MKGSMRPRTDRAGGRAAEHRAPGIAARRRAARCGFALAFALGLGLSLAPFAGAQVSDYGQKQMGAPAEDTKPTVLTNVNIAQHLDRPLPLGAAFIDETGRAVHLGDYFNGTRPAILALVYYKCPMLCSEELNGLVGALEMVHFNPGKDFDVIVASIDPSETPADAAKKKASLLRRYARPQTAGGWHFLTGQEPAIAALATATGFGYTRTTGPDGKMNQFAHASSIQLVTPKGVIAQYYMGVEYSPNDIRLGLVEASAGRIGSPVDEILTYCYRYDPARNGHSLLIARIVQAACMLTMILLGAYMLINFRRDYLASKLTAAKLTPSAYASTHGNG